MPSSTSAGGHRRSARRAPTLLLATLLTSACTDVGERARPVGELVLERAITLDVAGRFDASGLAIRDGEFFVLNDRDEETIFRLEMNGDVARVVPAIRYRPPRAASRPDVEGLAVAPDGGFYVASEAGYRVLHVPASGGAATWVTPDLRAAGEAAGFFTRRNAALEGVLPIAADRWLVAAERQERGLLEVTRDAVVRTAVFERSRYEGVHRRALDFTDLAAWRGRRFALARSQHLVVELIADADGAVREGSAWSYAETENAPGLRYADRTFGMAEGLAIDDPRLYVLLDNNGIAREGEPSDTRPQLFVFGNPMSPVASDP